MYYGIQCWADWECNGTRTFLWLMGNNNRPVKFKTRQDASIHIKSWSVNHVVAPLPEELLKDDFY